MEPSRVLRRETSGVLHQRAGKLHLTYDVIRESRPGEPTVGQPADTAPLCGAEDHGCSPQMYTLDVLRNTEWVDREHLCVRCLAQYALDRLARPDEVFLVPADPASDEPHVFEHASQAEAYSNYRGRGTPRKLTVLQGVAVERLMRDADDRRVQAA